jgi:hypothetical protein
MRYKGAVDMRVLYLQRFLRVNGREAFAGRRVFDLLREHADAALLGHLVWPTEEPDQSPVSRFPDDLIPEATVREWRPDVIVTEGGLFDDAGRWFVPKPLLQEFCENGGVAVVTGSGSEDLRNKREYYSALVDGSYAAHPFGAHTSWADEETPAYGKDDEHAVGGSRLFACVPEKMVIDPWLQPAYEGVRALVACEPVQVSATLDGVLASGNYGTTRVFVKGLYGQSGEVTFFPLRPSKPSETDSQPLLPRASSTTPF